MEIKITQVTDVKSDNRGGVSSKIHAGNEQYYVNEDATVLVGKTVDITYETKTSKKGNQYKVAKINKVLDGDSPSQNGHIRWADYHKMASIAHALARTLEPDEKEIAPDESCNNQTFIKLDRSSARAAILNTVMIAFSNGKISLPNEEEDDTIPF